MIMVLVIYHFLLAISISNASFQGGGSWIFVPIVVKHEGKMYRYTLMLLPVLFYLPGR